MSYNFSPSLPFFFSTSLADSFAGLSHVSDHFDEDSIFLDTLTVFLLALLVLCLSTWLDESLELNKDELDKSEELEDEDELDELEESSSELLLLLLDELSSSLFLSFLILTLPIFADANVGLIPACFCWTADFLPRMSTSADGGTPFLHILRSST